MYKLVCCCNFEIEPLKQSVEHWSSILGIKIYCEFLQDFGGLKRPASAFWLFSSSSDKDHNSYLKQFEQLYDAHTDQILLLPGACEAFSRIAKAKGGEINSEILQFANRMEEPKSPELEELIELPLRPAFWQALGLDICRCLYLSSAPPCKLIAVDADFTLWEGACAEGPVTVTEEYEFLHHFLSEKKREGKILCLISKNDADDVRAAFESINRQNSSLLSLNDFTYVGADWQEKTTHILHLSESLHLDLSSFAFLDDNDSECLQVQRSLPAVNLICLPHTGRTELLTDYAWFLDRRTYERENADRTIWYKNLLQQPEDDRAAEYRREPIAVEFRTLRQLSKLEIDRVSELSFRTTQFNFSGKRWLPDELTKAEETSFSVFLKDSTHDYGLVGAAMCQSAANILTVQNVFLSCRVLGKGVEEAIFEKIAEVARLAGLDQIFIDFAETNRNRPAKSWFSAIGPDGPTARLMRVSKHDIHQIDSTSIETGSEQILSANWTRLQQESRLIHWKSDTQRVETTSSSSLTAKLLDAWTSVLGTTPSPDDSIFDQGADSLAVASFVARVRKVTGIKIPLSFPYRHPNVGEMAAAIPLFTATETIKASSNPRVRKPQILASTFATTPVFIASANRPRLAQRCVESVPSKEGGTSFTPIAVIQSADQSTEQAYYDLNCNVISYDEQNALYAYLNKNKFPETVLNFLLRETGIPDVNTTGVNRNYCLLMGAGTTFLSLDDDALWSFVRPTEHFVGPGAYDDPCSYWITPPRLEQVQEPYAELQEALTMSSEPTAVAFAGIYGDCGLFAPFGIWGRPYGQLALVGDSLERFTQDYSVNSRSRQQLRVTDKALAAEFGQTVCFAIKDEGTAGAIAPFFPFGRGQDLIWCLITKLCGVPLFQAPLAVEHKAAMRREFTRSEITSTARGIDVCRYVMAAIKSSTGGYTKPLSTSEVGSALVSLASRHPTTLDDTLRQAILNENKNARDWLLRQRDTNPRLPDEWKQDITIYCEVLAEAEHHEDYMTPLDLPVNKGRAKSILRESLFLYGEALQHWPRICESARAISGFGLKLLFASGETSATQTESLSSPNEQIELLGSPFWSRRIEGAPIVAILPNYDQFRPIAERIEADTSQTSIVTLQSYFLHRDVDELPDSPEGALEYVANRHLSELPRNCDVLLLAHCNSGRIAAELAAKLQDRNQRVLGLILVESYMGFPPCSRVGKLFNLIRSTVRLGPALGFGYLSTFVSKWCTGKYRRLAGKISPMVPQRKSLTYDPLHWDSIRALDCPIRLHRSAELIWSVAYSEDAKWSNVSPHTQTRWYKALSHQVLTMAGTVERVVEDVHDLLHRTEIGEPRE